MDNKRIAKRLIRLAKSLTAAEYPAYEKYVADTIKNALGDYEDVFDDKFETYNNDIEEVEHISRDGFISRNDGGFKLVSWTTVGNLSGSGYYSYLPEGAEKIYNQIVKSNEKIISDEMKDKYPEEFKDVKLVTYSHAEKVGLENEWESYEDAVFEDDTIMFELGCFYNDGVKDRKPHEAYVWCAINFEAPYHRSGKMEWYEDAKFEFKNEQELKSGLDKALKKVTSKL